MDNKKAIEEFEYKLCRNFIEQGATYSSIILAVECTVLASYSTNQKWEREYHESGLSKSCHLIGATKLLSKKSDNFTLIWDLFAPNNEYSLFLNHKRKENKICHGVSFCKKNKNGILEILTLAARNSDINFSSQVIRNKKKIEECLINHKHKYLSKNSNQFNLPIQEHKSFS